MNIMNWISVKDRFPELTNDFAGPETKEVIVFGDGNQWGVAVYDYEQHKWVNKLARDIPEITHWCEVTGPEEQ